MCSSDLERSSHAGLLLRRISDVWLSLMRRSNNPAWLDRSHHPNMYVWGKLKTGVTVDQARAEMKTIAAMPFRSGSLYGPVTFHPFGMRTLTRLPIFPMDGLVHRFSASGHISQ